MVEAERPRKTLRLFARYLKANINFVYFTINAASNTLMKQFYPDEEILIRKVLFKFKFTVLSLILKSDGCDLFCINYK